MLVHGPAAVGHGVFKDAVGQNILLFQDVVAQQAAALAHAAEIADPDQLIVFCAVVAAVFDVIPDAVDRAVQLPADILGLLDDIVPVAAQLDPPISALDVVFFHQLVGMALIILIRLEDDDIIGIMIDHDIAVITVLEVGFVEGIGPVGLDEFDGMAAVLGHEVNRVAHGLAVGDGRRVPLLIFVAALAADLIFRTGLVAQRAVARGVDKDAGGQLKAQLGRHLITFDGGDVRAVGMDGGHAGVHIEGEVFGLLGGVPEDAVPDGIVIAVVQVFVFELKLHQDARLGGVLFAPVAGGAGDVHPHLGAGIAAEHTAILHDGGLCALARGGHGGAESAHAAADDDHVEMQACRSGNLMAGNLMDIVFHKYTSQRKRNVDEQRLFAQPLVADLLFSP